MLGKPSAFGPFLLNADKGTLLRDNEPVPVGQRGILLLAALLKRPGEVLTKSELMDAAWPNTTVEESNLSVQIALLRKALGPSPGGGDWIATIPRIGYRFVGPRTQRPDTEAGPHSAIPTLAVLPFVNLSNDPDQAFFVEGLAEEIVTALSKLSGLVVIARNSSFGHGGHVVDPSRVADELGARYLLAGSVRRGGNRIRMAVRLIDSSTDGHVWAESYDRELVDVFAVQDEVTREIVKALEVALSPAEATVLSQSGTRNLEALNCCLRARAIQRGPTQNLEVFRRATGLLYQAIEHDPLYAEAYSALATAHLVDWLNGWTETSQESLATGLRFAAQGIEKDPSNPFGHAVAALLLMFNKDLERSATEIETALSINPNHPLAVNLRGNLLVYSGEPTAAIPYIERAIRLDPGYTQQHLHFLGMAYLVAGSFETAAALFKDRILLVPASDMTRAYLAAALGHLGQIEEAGQVWRELKTINPGYSFAERLARLPFRKPGDVEMIVEGVRKAGLAA